jgi:hypothetical protein
MASLSNKSAAAAALAQPDPAGPSVFEAAQHAKDSIPPSAHEYQMRKALGDAAYQTLSYLPVCTHMPTCTACAAPAFVWVSLGRACRGAAARHHATKTQHGCLVSLSYCFLKRRK